MQLLHTHVIGNYMADPDTEFFEKESPVVLLATPIAAKSVCDLRNQQTHFNMS